MPHAQRAPLADKENASNANANKQVTATACCPPAGLIITKAGLQRAPCERSRCVARRNAMKHTQREAAIAWLRLILRAWHSYCVTPLATKALLRIIARNQQQAAMRESYKLWSRCTVARAADASTLLVAELCAREVAVALEGGGRVRDDLAAYDEYVADEEEDDAAYSDYQPFACEGDKPTMPPSRARGGESSAVPPRAAAAAPPKPRSTLRLVDTEKLAAAVSEAVHGLVGQLQQRLREHYLFSTTARLVSSLSAPASPKARWGDDSAAAPPASDEATRTAMPAKSHRDERSSEASLVTAVEGRRHASRTLLDALMDEDSMPPARALLAAAAEEEGLQHGHDHSHDHEHSHLVAEPVPV